MEKYTQEIIYYCVFIVSGSFHEAAHAWSAWRLGDPTARSHGRMTINPFAHIDLVGTVLFPLLNIFFGGFFIGWMRPVPVFTPNLRSPLRDSLFVSLAGPFANLFLAFVAAGVLWGLALTGLESIPMSLSFLLQAVIVINLLLALFNLLPVPPLDGSTLVDTIRRDRNETYHRQAGIGILILYGLLFFGFLRYLWRGVIGVMGFILADPWIPVVCLAVAAGIVVLFALKNRPGGVVKVVRKKKPKAEVEAERILERARAVAAALARGEHLSEADRRFFEELERDPGDGDVLCAKLSFDVRNDFCRRCPNLKRCIVRDAKESANGTR